MAPCGDAALAPLASTAAGPACGPSLSLAPLCAEPDSAGLDATGVSSAPPAPRGLSVLSEGEDPRLESSRPDGGELPRSWNSLAEPARVGGTAAATGCGDSVGEDDDPRLESSRPDGGELLLAPAAASCDGDNTRGTDGEPCTLRSAAKPNGTLSRPLPTSCATGDAARDRSINCMPAAPSQSPVGPPGTWATVDGAPRVGSATTAVSALAPPPSPPIAAAPPAAKVDSLPA